MADEDSQSAGAGQVFKIEARIDLDSYTPHSLITGTDMDVESSETARDIIHNISRGLRKLLLGPPKWELRGKIPRSEKRKGTV